MKNSVIYKIVNNFFLKYSNGLQFQTTEIVCLTHKIVRKISLLKYSGCQLNTIQLKKIQMDKTQAKEQIFTMQQHICYINKCTSYVENKHYCTEHTGNFRVTLKGDKLVTDTQ